MGDNWFLIYKGVNVGQTPKITEVFKSVLNEFDRIIEIGSHAGGLAYFLHDNMKEGCDLVSYDINTAFNTVPRSVGIDYRGGDCFALHTRDEIKDLIVNTSKRVLLLCDGGDKIREFNVFSEYLKPDDVIMCHDYAETNDDFNAIKENLGWMSIPESSYNEISDAIDENNLKKYHYNEFKSVLWGAFIKE